MATRTATYAGGVQNTGPAPTTYEVRLAVAVTDLAGDTTFLPVTLSAPVTVPPGQTVAVPAVTRLFTLFPGEQAQATAALWAINPVASGALDSRGSALFTEPSVGVAGALTTGPTISGVLAGAALTAPVVLAEGGPRVIGLRSAGALGYAIQEHFDPGQRLRITLLAPRAVTGEDARVAEQYLAQAGIPARARVGREPGWPGALAVDLLRPSGPTASFALAFDGLSILLGFGAAGAFLIRDQIASKLVPLALITGGTVALAVLFRRR